MKKQIWFVIILGVIMVILLGVLFLVPAKQTPQSKVDGLEVVLPKANDEISSPLKITGTVSGNGWSGFEGQVGRVELLDSNGMHLAGTYLAATTEWTSLPTNFEATVIFQSVTNQAGTLVFHNENASGLPEKDRTFTLPVKIKSTEEAMVIKAYFGKSDGTANQDCSAVLPLDRIVPKNIAVAQTAIDELLKGPTTAEKNAGFFTSIPAGSKLNSITIVNGVANVDFNAVTESGGGSCSMAARVAQITKTLMQFPTITSVRLSVDGRTGDVIFQP